MGGVPQSSGSWTRQESLMVRVGGGGDSARSLLAGAAGLVSFSSISQPHQWDSVKG